MGGADGVAGQFGRGGLVEVVQEIGGLDGDIEQRALARGPVVDTGSHHQMAVVVGLEIQPVVEGPTLGRSGGRSHQAAVVGGRLATVALGDDDLGVHVAVLALGLGDGGNDLVHQLVQGRIPGHGIDGGHALEPLEEVTVVEGGTMVVALGLARGDFQVAIGMAEVGIVHDVPHVEHHRVSAHFETVAPEAVGPGHRGDVGVPYPGVLAVVGVDHALVLGRQQQRAHQHTTQKQNCSSHKSIVN